MSRACLAESHLRQAYMLQQRQARRAVPAQRRKGRPQPNAAETEAAATSDAHTLIGLRPKLPPSLEERTLLHHRRLIKREPLSSAERGVLETELAAMGEWMTGEEEKATELHVVDTRSAEEKAAEAQVQRLLEADVAASA